MKETLKITGMSCSACSASIEKALHKQNGIQSAAVNLLSETLTVTYDPTQIRLTEMITCIQGLGYGASAKADTTQKISPVKDNTMKKRMLWSFGLLLPLMYVSMGSMVGLPLPFFLNGTANAVSFALVQLLLTLPIVVFNRSYFIKGFSLLVRGAPNMDSLIAVGSGAALVYGVFALLRMSYALGANDLPTVHHYHMELYFESAAMILTLITFGKFLEARSKGKTSAAIERLLDMSPKTALVLRNGQELEIPADSLVKGDTVVVKPGMRIPADGMVLSGHSAVDESAITGESLPAEKATGDYLRAATVNGWGNLSFEAQQVGQDTSFAEIIRLVEDAGSKKAPIAQLADRISGIFVPVVMGIALLSVLVWLLVGAAFSFALSIGISVLVISCPCALGLATPVAVMVGTGKGAEMGVLMKSGEAFETTGKVTTVVFDKTGTLTTGKHKVQSVITLDPLLPQIACSLEALSEHPLAQAVVAYCHEETPLTVNDFIAIPGRGVQGRINSTLYYGGSPRFIQEETGLSLPQKETQGTALVFASKNQLLGAFYTADALKKDSKQAIDSLRAMGIKTLLLTGDNQQAAQQIGTLTGVDKVLAEVLPSEKEQEIRALMTQGQIVAMVGDGINDAPALTAASVGIAMGSGTDIAVESAGVVLTGESLLAVPKAIQLSKAVTRNIGQNLFWAFFYNAVGIPIAAGVWYMAFALRLNPMLGALAMSLSSVCVVANALRLRRFRPHISKTVQKEQTNMKTVTIAGMMCQHCEGNVKRVLSQLDSAVQVDLAGGYAKIANTTDNAAIAKAITDAGYEVISIT